ncbi:MAG TPA: ATP-dependent Clp protease ATP-binding subunit [Ktedonobacteraceae bacterium]|nr:ATP-dependent Clp protease ATP-binding subunit [Ktedonobacteraceae bacterium]
MSQPGRYTEEARKALLASREEALQLRHRVIGPEHLLLGMFKINDPIIECVLLRLYASSARLKEALEFVVGRGNKALLSQPALGQGARAALGRAEEVAAQMEESLIGTEHLLLGVLGDQESVAAGVLESFGLSLQAVRKEIEMLLSLGRDHANFAAQYQVRYNQTPILNQVSRDLTTAALAGSVDPMIGRESELERVMQILSRRSKNNPVLIGPAGVGKTAIAEGLALRIIQGSVPENLQQRRVVSLEVGLLTVGTRFRGDFEERLKLIMQEVLDSKGIIIVIDELHALVGAGVAEGSIDAANLFKPMLARGEFQCIGTTTLDDYRKTVETDPALERRFQPVMVNETTPEQTMEVLRGLRPQYAEYHQVTITDDALIAAVQMSTRYIQDRFQPDKSLDLIDEAAARVRANRSTVPDEVRKLREELVALQRDKDAAISRKDFTLALQLRGAEKQLRQALSEAENAWSAQQQQERPLVDQHVIAEVVAMWTGIPTARITTEEAERLLKLEEELHQRVIGQHEAVQAVARAVRRARADMRDSHRPIGSFLFVGPTGVGKTEVARALAETLFGDEEAMLKLDMSEFMESHHVSRLLGSPPGYVGYEQAGQLTEAVRRRPYSVLLFDEIEKAHPKIFDLLLQILDDGCLTDAQGHSVSFKNTIIIITSNAGTAHLKNAEMSFVPARRNKQEQQAGAATRVRAQVLPALKELFRPELLNRIDEVIVFHALEPEHLRVIVDLMISKTRQRIAGQEIALEVTGAARSLLAERGYDPVYGARPLRRTVQRLLDDLLAESLLRGDYQAGDTVEVDVVDGQLAARVLARVGVSAGQAAA